jgi:hypothetical protein
MRDTVWTCRDGRSLLVSEMTDSHLRNAINMILRHRRWRRSYLERLLLEEQIRAMGVRFNARPADRR